MVGTSKMEAYGNAAVIHDWLYWGPEQNKKRSG